MAKTNVMVALIMAGVNAWRGLKNSGLSFKAAGLMNMGFNYHDMVKVLHGIESQQEKSDDFKKYEEELSLLKLSLQAPVEKASANMIVPFANGAEAAAAIRDLQSKYRSAIDEQKAKEKAYNELMYQEVEVNITKIPWSEVMIKGATEKDGKIVDVPDGAAVALGDLMFCIDRPA